MVDLSVGQFTAIEVDPAEYIAIAASAGAHREGLRANFRWLTARILRGYARHLPQLDLQSVMSNVS